MNVDVARQRRRASDGWAGASLAVLAVLGLAAALVITRGVVDSAVTALTLATAVTVAGTLGGWRVGLCAAIAAAVGFNFFHTQPYLSLEIHSIDDVFTTGALALLGMVAGASGDVARRRGRAQTVTRGALDAVAVVAAAVGDEDLPVDDLVQVCCDEIEWLLKLETCALAPSPRADLPVMDRAGLLGRDDEFTTALPAAGFVIAIPAGGGVRHLICIPRPGVDPAQADRLAAVVTAELLGPRLAADAPARP